MFDLSLNPKEVGREKYLKNRKGRKNYKENKQHAFRQAKRKRKEETSKIKPHSTVVEAEDDEIDINFELKYEPIHKGTHQIVYQESVGVPLSCDPNVLSYLASRANWYNILNPHEVIRCPHHWLYVVVPEEDTEIVYQVSTIDTSLFWRFSERESVRFLVANNPHRYWVPIIPHNGEDPLEEETNHVKDGQVIIKTISDQERMEMEEIIRNEEYRTKGSDAPDAADEELLAEAVKNLKDVSETLPDDQQYALGSFMQHGEGIVIFAYQMMRSRNFADAMAAVVSFVRPYFYAEGTSITAFFYKLLEDLVTPSQDEIVPHSSVADVVEKWDLIRGHLFWKKISYLISAAMSMTICKFKSIEWSPFGFKLIHIEAAKHQLNAVDMIDTVIKTFAWMFETGAQCLKEGSIAPLLYGDQKMREFHNLTDYVTANADAYLAGNREDFGSFEKKVTQAIALVARLKKARPDGTTADWLQRKYEKLVGILERCVAKRKNSDLRFAPFGVSIFGNTGVGKSTLTKLLIRSLLLSMQFDYDKNRVINLDVDDPFQSTWTSDVLAMVADDVGNTKPEFTKGGNGMNPMAMLIKFFNNVNAQALKAELNEKGMVFIDFKVGIVTTNKKDLDARIYSNAPESILRRFVHVTAEVKDEYQKKGGVSLDSNHPEIKAANGKKIIDVWNLKIEECVPFLANESRVAYEFQPFNYKLDGKEILTKDLDLKTFMMIINDMAKTHMEAQKRVLTLDENLDSIEYCSLCNIPREMCGCKPVTIAMGCDESDSETVCKEIKPHSLDMANIGDTLVSAIQSSVANYLRSYISPICTINGLLGYSPIKNMATGMLARELENDLHSYATPLAVSIMPEALFRTKYFQSAIGCWQSSAAYCDVRTYCHRLAIGTTAMVGVSAVKRSLPMAMITAAASTGMGLFLYSGYVARKMAIRQAYLSRRDALPEYAKKLRDSVAPKIAVVSVALVVGVKLLSLWNEKRIVSQGLENPDDVNSSPGWFDNWTSSISFSYKSDDSLKTTTPNQAVDTLHKNLWWAKITRDDGSTLGCNLLCLQTGMPMLPDHVFYPKADMNLKPCEGISVEVFKNEKGGHGKFNFKAERSVHSYLFPGKDLRLCYTSMCADVKAAWKYLPESEPQGSSLAKLMVRQPDCTMKVDSICATMKKVNHIHQERTHGGEYNSELCKMGACMGLVVSDCKEPVILGTHIGGNGVGYGIMQTLTKQEYLKGVTELAKQEGVMILAHSVELPEKQLEKQVLMSEKVNPKAKFIKELDNTAAVRVFGSTRLRAKQKSQVVASILTAAVLRVMCVACCHGKPLLSPNWAAYNRTLEHVINPALPVYPSEMMRALQDWLGPLLILMKEYVIYEKGMFRPLTLQEAIDGIAGKRFIDALIMRTSMGFPEYGPKEKHFAREKQDDGTIKRVPNQKVIDEVNRLLAAYKRGERGYPICAATLKDEPTKIGSEKVRVFQAAPVAMSILIRMYFLPIARFLSLHPLESECAVGVNAVSPEWKQLMDHANKFAKDGKVIAWDYSKYDVRMNSQMTGAVLWAYIKLARAGGYPPEALQIMEKMVADIIHPMIDWNGTLLMAFNMNTSGNNITVNINSTAGSLYVRLGFFHVYGHAKDFRSAVGAMTYGDDFKGSVHPDWRKFNCVSFRKYLETLGIKITRPDKKALLPGEKEEEFLNDADTDFLKRVSNMVEGIPVPLGKLTEESIFKSLHCNLKSSKATEREVAISCIETALHEWFVHGKETYELRLAQLKEVCVEVDLPITKAFMSFEERVEGWHGKYGAQLKELQLKESKSKSWLTFENALKIWDFFNPVEDEDEEDSDMESVDLNAPWEEQESNEDIFDSDAEA